MNTKDVIVRLSCDTEWKMWCSMPLDNRKTLWSKTQVEALKLARNMAIETGGVVYLRDEEKSINVAIKHSCAVKGGAK